MSQTGFFEKKGPFSLKKIIEQIGHNGKLSNIDNLKISGLESLDNAKNSDMTFLNSAKYKDLSLKTKAGACITSINLSKFLPETCIKIEVKNILFAVTQASRMFYPNADFDLPDQNLVESEKINSS